MPPSADTSSRRASSRSWRSRPGAGTRALTGSYLSDALHAYAVKAPAFGQVIDGRWYDTGSPEAYLVAQFAAALANPEYRPVLRRLFHDLDTDAEPETNH